MVRRVLYEIGRLIGFAACGLVLFALALAVAVR
jgi:hypothetical protein